MSRKDLTVYWEKEFGVEPRTAILREKLRERWFRIYSLPEGKRYAETRKEQRVLLERHLRVMGALFWEETQMVLITTGFSAAGVEGRPQDSELRHPLAWHWRTMPAEAWDLNGASWHLYGRDVVWGQENFDKVIMMAAEDKSANVIVLGVGRGCLYMPYDGGADVIASSAEHCAWLKREFGEWGSLREDGL